MSSETRHLTFAFDARGCADDVGAGGEPEPDSRQPCGPRPALRNDTRKGEVVRRPRKTTGAIVGCAAVLLGMGLWAPRALGAAPRTTSLAIPPGVYSGTVRMSGVNNCVSKRYLETLTGT